MHEGDGDLEGQVAKGGEDLLVFGEVVVVGLEQGLPEVDA